MSAAWLSEPYLVFAHHLLARADQFATQYNAALANTGWNRRSLHQAARCPIWKLGPMNWKVAFWLDDLKDESRQRLTLRRAGDGGLLVLGRGSETGDSFIFDPNKPGETAAKQLLAFLNHHHLRIAPLRCPLPCFSGSFWRTNMFTALGEDATTR